MLECRDKYLPVKQILVMTHGIQGIGGDSAILSRRSIPKSTKTNCGHKIRDADGDRVIKKWKAGVGIRPILVFVGMVFCLFYRGSAM